MGEISEMTQFVPGIEGAMALWLKAGVVVDRKVDY